MSTVRLYKNGRGAATCYRTTPFPHGDKIGQEYVLPAGIELVYAEGRVPFLKSEEKSYISLITNSEQAPCLFISGKEIVLEPKS